MALATTESYPTLAEADTYWETNRAGSDWDAATDANKEKALREATQFLDGTYIWIGEHPGSTSQPLGWPRSDAEDHEGRVLTGIPSAIKDAACELALEALGGALLPVQSRGGDTQKVKVGSIAVEYGGSASAFKTFEFVDRILVGMFSGKHSSGATSLERV